MNKLILAFGFLLVLSCKPLQQQQSESLSVFDNPSASNLQPATHYVLKRSLKRMIEGIQLVQSGIEDGAHIYTVTRLNFGDIQPSSRGVAITVDIDLSIRAKKGQYIALGASAGANVSFQGRASVLLEIAKNGPVVDIVNKGITWTQPLSHHISVWTNARLLRQVVRNKAYQAAAQAIPSSKAQIKQQLAQQINNGLAEQKGQFQQHFAEIARMMEDVPTASPHLFSQRGEAFFQHLLPAEAGARLSPAPQSPAGVDSGFSFNQHVFEHLLNRRLKGKIINIQALQLEVCKSFSKFYYEICAKEPIQRPMQADIIFDDKRPTEFVFDNNQITTTFVGQIKVSAGEISSQAGSQQEFAGTDFTIDDGIEGVSHVTPAVRVKLVYALGNRQFERQEVTVEVLAPEAGDGLLTRSSLYRRAFEWMVKSQFEQALPQWFPIPSAPAYVSSDPRIASVGGAFVVKDKNHFSTSNGWINAYFTYCSKQDTQTALGIRMRTVPDTGGKNRIKITGIIDNTPAKRAKVVKFGPGYSQEGVEFADYEPAPGLQVGDVIYNVDGSDAMVSDPIAFGTYLAGRSLIPDRKTVKFHVARRAQLVNPENTATTIPVWINIDYEVELQKVCKTAQ